MNTNTLASQLVSKPPALYGRGQEVKLKPIDGEAVEGLSIVVGVWYHPMGWRYEVLVNFALVVWVYESDIAGLAE